MPSYVLMHMNVSSDLYIYNAGQKKRNFESWDFTVASKTLEGVFLLYNSMTMFKVDPPPSSRPQKIPNSELHFILSASYYILFKK